MVKRLRRRPLTAESGVRFPLGLPINNLIMFFLCVDNNTSYISYRNIFPQITRA